MDKQMIDKYLESFSRITGLKVSLIDSRFRGIRVCGYEAGEYCSLLHTSGKCLESCIASNVDAFNNARKLGEAYVYRCPFDLGEIVVPIKEGNSVVGYLIAAPILKPMENSDELLKKHFIENDLEIEDEKAENAIARIKKYSTDSVRALCDMLSLIAVYIEREGIMSDCNKTVGQLAKDYVKRNLSGRITLAEISAYAHCSTVTLTEHFRREFGMSVMEYVAKKRMALAEELLLSTSLSVTDISGRCGFGDVEYFSKCFKRRYGISPIKYRRKYRE